MDIDLCGVLVAMSALGTLGIGVLWIGLSFVWSLRKEPGKRLHFAWCAASGGIACCVVAVVAILLGSALPQEADCTYDHFALVIPIAAVAVGTSVVRLRMRSIPHEE